MTENEAGGHFQYFANGLLKMASIKAAGSEEPEAYESVRRRGLATENAEGGHFSAARQAEVAELADALDSGSSALTGVRVQIPASAPTPFSLILLQFTSL
jgi:hypothetical protein